MAVISAVAYAMSAILARRIGALDSAESMTITSSLVYAVWQVLPVSCWRWQARRQRSARIRIPAARLDLANAD